MKRWLYTLLEIHSPSEHILGTCWCFKHPRYWKKRLPHGLCAIKQDHAPHAHYSGSLGSFWCTADQSERQPWKGEQEQKRHR